MSTNRSIFELKKRLEDWESGPLKQSIEHIGERKKKFETVSSLRVKNIYTPLDMEEGGFDYLKSLNFPGEYPFTRGIEPNMYRSKLWIMGQYSGFGSPEELNRRIKTLIEQGQTGFSLALDLPTQIGLDSDHPLARGEVGKVGAAIDTLKDMESIMEGIRFNAVRQIRTSGNAIGPIALAWFVAVGEKQGISHDSYSVMLQNDVLKEYVARGTQFLPPRPAMGLVTDVIAYCARNLPTWTPTCICGGHFRESGASAIQEVAFAFSDGIAYIEETLKKGIRIDEFAPKLWVFFNGHNDLFEEVAKFRAARRVWAKMMKNRFGAKDPKSMMLKILVYTGGSTLTAQQPLNNVIRITLNALGAVLGGVTTLATSSFDEALAIPTDLAARTALRTQQIIAEEYGVANTVDPLGGSYFVESLTDQLEEEIEKYIEKVDAIGGAVAAIEKGFYKKEITNAAFKFQKEIESGERVVVGVNKYRVDEEEAPTEIFEADPEWEKKQIDRLRRVKKERNNNQVKETLSRVEDAASQGKNLVQPIYDAVKAYTTIGEICDSLKKVYGEYRAETFSF